MARGRVGFSGQFSKEKHHRQKNKEQFKKFKGSSAEGQGFADKRKRKVQYEYMKMLKKEKQKDLAQRLRTLASEPCTSQPSEPHTSTDIDGQKHITHSKRSPQFKVQRSGWQKPNSKYTKCMSSESKMNKFHSQKTETVGSEFKEASDHSSKGRQSSSLSGMQTNPKYLKDDASSEDEKPHKRQGKDSKMFKAEWKKRKIGDGSSSKMAEVNRFSKALEEQKRKKEMKLQKAQEYAQKKAAREKAMEAYQKKKKDTFKLICKKTRKGQPVMKNQMEYLLQKIEKQIQQNP